MKSVTGFSLLDYVLDIARFFSARKVEKASYEELVNAILKSSKKRRDRWLVQVAIRKTKSPTQAGPIRDCLDAMSDKWGLLEREDDMFSRTSRLLRIGELLEASHEVDAKRDLLDAIIRSKKEIPFSPSNILLKIRNRTSPQLFRIVFSCSYKSDDGVRKSKVLPQPGPECIYANGDGTALDDFVFVKDILMTNFRAFDIMCDWGLFFELFDYVSLESEDLKDILVKKAGQGYLEQVARSAGCSSAAVYRPTRRVYLTEQMASVGEIMSVAQGIEDSRLSNFSRNDVRNLYAILHSVEKNTSKEEVLVKAKARGCLILSDGPDIFGIPNDTEFQEVDPDKTYLFTSREVSINELASSVHEVHQSLTGGRPIVPVWIGDLSEATCYRLRIPESVFTRNLLTLKQVGKVQFHKAPLFGQVAGPKMRRRKPIEFAGRAYQQVSLA